MKVAVLDIGTLKVKFLIAEAKSAGNITTKYESNRLTCLGVRMAENGGKPHDNYLKDTISEIKRCKKLLDKQKITKFRAVSTHALREMGEVREEIAEKIKKEVGLTVEIISQKEEAHLFFNAVISDFRTSKDFTLVDVGGGSVQILIGNTNKLKETHLLKTGAQFLFDTFSPRHKGSDFPTREEIRKMQKYVMKELTPIPKNIKTPLIYGSSNIIDVFKSTGMKLNKFPYSQSNPYKSRVSEVESFLKNIIPIPYDTREKMYKFRQKYYMWGIDKALVNIVEISKKINAPYIIPTNSNINNGLVLSMARS